MKFFIYSLVISVCLLISYTVLISIPIAEPIATFHAENKSLVLNRSFAFVSGGAEVFSGGKMYFSFFIPGYAGKEPKEDANIYIKVSSGNKILLQKKRSFKEVGFYKSSSREGCNASGYINDFLFDVSNIYNKLKIEIHCECEKLEAVHVFLYEKNEFAYDAIRTYKDELDKKYPCSRYSE